MDKEEEDKFGFEKLKVYQKALDYVDFVYAITEKFPKTEVFGLTSQFQRASCSIALNIGEGSGGILPVFKNFIRISYCSLNECVVCSTMSLRRNYIDKTQEKKSRTMLAEISRMLSGLRKSL
jgi:four helix bundle protein